MYVQKGSCPKGDMSTSVSRCNINVRWKVHPSKPTSLSLLERDAKPCRASQAHAQGYNPLRFQDEEDSGESRIFLHVLLALFCFPIHSMFYSRRLDMSLLLVVVQPTLAGCLPVSSQPDDCKDK